MRRKTQRCCHQMIGIRVEKVAVGLLLAAAALMVLSACGKKEE